jgi:hypothetical protein
MPEQERSFMLSDQAQNGIRLLVCGGRDFNDTGLAHRALSRIHDEFHIKLLIHGDAHGADRICGAWARASGIPVLPYPADWDDLSHPDALIKCRKDGTPYDARAGIRRNGWMLEEGRPHMLLALPGGTGTADMTRKAFHAGIKIIKPSHSPQLELI